MQPPQCLALARGRLEALQMSQGVADQDVFRNLRGGHRLPEELGRLAQLLFAHGAQRRGSGSAARASQIKHCHLVDACEFLGVLRVLRVELLRCCD